ncbi:TIGR01212 family radical SAM protein [Thermophagus sp. OGC60D27]|uniref:TIGR01212 family radical SAM protein n=1 Tax=Thermophagus sp. OGC60D27 TaxID=3458415 RepID=UPI004037B26E
MTVIYPWGNNNPFNDYSSFLKNKFHRRVQKLSLNVGFTCPNRDGTKGRGGCTFCNNNSFNPDYCEPDISITDQLNKGISFFDERYPDQYYLAYFQAYTNTYGPLDQLKRLYEEALSHPKIYGLVIGTRPDCLPDELIEWLSSLQSKHYIVVELGIESTDEETLVKVNRGHTFEETRDAILRLNQASIPVGSHLILGLPGETTQMMLEHAERLSSLPLGYLKIHQLQYVRGSALGHQYLNNPEEFRVFDVDEYVDLVIAFLERLSPRIVVERLASQAPYHLLIAPKWGLKNFQLTELVKKRMKERNTWQGKLLGVCAAEYPTK